MSEEQVNSVGPRLAMLYQKLSVDEHWNRVPSPLPFCFVDRPRREGQYVLVRPVDADADAGGVPTGPTVVFLHGFAGSFLANIYLVAEAMPDATIIAPSWPRSWADGPDWYLKQAIDDAETRLDRPLSDITLVGLSDGGKVVARYAARDRGRVKRIVSLAMTMPKSDLARLPRDTPVLLVCGSRDERVGIERAREQGQWLGKRFAHATFVEVDGDHFFLLAPANDTLAQLAALVRAEHSDPAPVPR